MSVSGRRRDGKSGGGGRDRINFEERESHRKHNFYQDKESNGGRDKKRERNQDKERDQSLKIEREHAQEKERHSDRHRDYRRHRSTNNEREKSNLDERDYFYGRGNNRQKYDHEKDRQYKYRSRSRSKDRYDKRTKSPSPPKSKRTSGFDMAPPIASGLPEPTATGNIGSLPVVPQLMSGTLPTMLPITASQFGSLGLMPAQAVAQQATRHARRIYVGGLPPMANEQTIATFFSHIMSAIGGNSAGPGDAVVNVYINHEKKFAFVEMRSVEEASNAMSLDGIIFEGVSVKVRRPTDYNASLAAALGPSQPSPHLNLAAVGLSSSNTIMGSEGPDRIFVGGLPYYFADAQIRELLESFGPLRGLDLVKDRDTGNSKGYGFCVYQDPSVTDIACAALNGLKMGEKTLTVRRATASMGQMKPEQELILQQAHEHIAMQKLAFKSGGISPFPEAGSVVNAAVELPTKVICLTEVVSVDELRDDAEYKEIVEDMREESEKFGSLINLVIPRPSQTGEMIPGVGKVFLEYANIADSARAKVALHGRRFGENVVCAAYYPEEKFSSGDYDTIVVV
ncbi:splicing factor U2af large subunit B-like isoform X2 [Zingiber officinale]|uniref:splicing factor U2af large subunit B-like isoform X2 n=2 Tax=Zingiber officinale TaxID=94328 RepID=UPI001C4B4DA0|nr:splicing factor U2af large subunit B-like isoform X2 [Zingiber officinale]